MGEHAAGFGAELSREIHVTSHSVEATRQLGRLLAEALVPGLVVALTGDLGAGKTQLCKALCTALHVPADVVSSPTFTLLQHYQGRLPIHHLDLYRLKSPEELWDLGFDDLLDDEAIVLVEWADRGGDLLPADTLFVQAEHAGETARRFTVRAGGPRSSRVVSEFARTCRDAQRSGPQAGIELHGTTD